MEAEALAPMMDANTLAHQETKWLWWLQEQQQLWQWQKGFITARKRSLAVEESQSRDREATDYTRFVNSAKHRSSRT